MGTLPPTETVALRLYLRQSLDEKAQQSIPTQLAECERLASTIGLAPTWPRAILYKDVDRSGDDASREGLARLLREAREGDIILAWKQDRVGRDTIDSASTIRELVKHRRCVLYTVETGTTAIKMDTAEQTAMVMLRGMVAQGELERIRTRTRDGLSQRAREGYASGSIPYGYKTVLVNPAVDERKKSKKRIEIVPEHAAIVRRILLDLYLRRKMGLSAICKLLNREGVPARGGKRAKLRGGVTTWAPSTLWDLLREPRYAGHWAHGERKVKTRLGRKKVVFERAPECEIIRVERPDLAILTADEWAELQAAVTERTRAMPQRRMMSTALLSGGRLRCTCGKAMSIRNEQKGKWSKRYYLCGDWRSGRCPSPQRVGADWIERQIVDGIKSGLLDRIEAKLLDAIADEEAAALATASEQTGDVERIRGELETLRKERQRLVRLAVAADDVPEVVEALHASQERTKALEHALALATRPPVGADMAQKLAALVRATIDGMRAQLDAGDTREALPHLFPEGLQLAPAPGGGEGEPRAVAIVQGEASVPVIRDTDGSRKIDTDAKIPFSLTLLAA